MLGRPVSLFKILGFDIKVDVSWLVLAAVIVWSLAKGLFPGFFKDLPASSYWWMGVAGALGLFMSIVFHELAHAIVARRYGIAMKGITLFIFGGVAEMEEEPPSAKAEFRMAMAGPLSSLFISGVLFFMMWAGSSQIWPVTFYGVLAYLAWLNLVLAVFNLVPAFPLDGGRVLRSILWQWKKDLPWATSVASRVGSVLGAVLIILGVISLFRGNIVGGLWWLMIGYFIRVAALRAYQQVLARDIFHGEKVGDLMVKDPVVVPRSITLHEFIHDYVYPYQFQLYPVVAFGKLSGCVTVAAVAAVPREEWTKQTVGSVVLACDQENTVGPDDGADQALAIMNRTGNSRLMVVQDDQLVGIISLKDMLKLLSLKNGLQDVEKKK
ncbi:MAG: site-2 protease family protein [Smithellaceae bacterium]